MILGLEGKVALVTGGARGLGAGICEAFAKEGANVVINYHSRPEEAEQFALRLENEYGIRALSVYADVSEEKEIMEMFDKIYEEFGTIDIVVNNAYNACNTKGPIEDFDPDAFEKLEKLTLRSALITSRELVKHCKSRHKPGHIVNMSSKSAFLTSSPNHISYIAVKGAMAAITRGLAFECAKDNIYVNAIIPGYAKGSRYDENSEKYNRVIQFLPMGRYAEPEEIADVVVFICSEKACQMNGVLLDVTGGTMSGQM